MYRLTFPEYSSGKLTAQQSPGAPISGISSITTAICYGCKAGTRGIRNLFWLCFFCLLFLSPLPFHIPYHQRAAHFADSHWDILEQRHSGIHCLEYNLHISSAHYGLLHNFPPEKIYPWYNFFGYSDRR